MWCLFLFSLVVGGPSADVPDYFKSLTFLVGTDWVATFPDGTSTDTQRFEWLYDGKFLRSVHWVKAAGGQVVYEGETIYAWDYENERIAWYYFNTSGGHLVGWMERTDEGYAIEGVNNAPTAQTPEVKGAFIFGDGQWQSVQFFKRGTEWVERMRIVYKPAEKK